ncbi:MAG TPA: DNA-processing protein DprA [Tepidisphaeraceae bacterium]|jgi:DNA processing protein
MATRDWLTLNLAVGIGPVIGRRLIDAAGSPAAAAAADLALLRGVEGVGVAKATKLAAALADARAKVDEEFAVAAAKATRVLSSDDDEWPAALRNIADAPLVLYCRGTIEPRDLNAVAIVGSRKCSGYGREQAERFAALLAGAGFTVVSGGARGVDSAAHRGAMSPIGGRTIAVIGSGIDVPYPPENLDLFHAIAGRGAVLSEFAFGTPPLAENFPRRNRIVSGLSRGVLVIEADERSGALITARQALEDHNRPVMALPGRADNPQSAGPHKLIRDGATLVTRLEHVLEALGPLDAALPEFPLFAAPDEPAAPPAKPGHDMSAAQTAIYSCLSVDPQSVDAICAATELDVSLVLRELTFLTLKARARRVDGQRFVRVS